MSNVVLFHAEELQPTAHAAEWKSNVLAMARLAPPITDDNSRAVVVELQAEIKTVLGEVERTRKKLKAPVLERGRAIDQAADSFRTELLAAYAGLNDKTEAYEDDKRALAAEQERIKQAEVAALDKSLPAASTPAQQEARDALLADKATELGPPVSLETARGQTVREFWAYEILDLGATWTSYGARLVELKEKHRAIVELINAPSCPTELLHGMHVPVIPGLRIRRQLSNQVRATRSPKLIELES